MLSIVTKNEADHYNIKVIGEMDIYTVDTVKNAVNQKMEESIKNLVFNFEELEYIDSTGLGALIGIKGKYKDINIEIVNLRSNVKRLFDLTGLAKIFSIK